ncbi:MAG: CvpA family protein [Ruminococcaceae bacterium]|nr:CvpA family protein [Oscillospiraceae bacterium]
MTMPVIMDIVAVAVLVGMTLWGARRGLVKTLAGLLIIIVALFGAGVIASSLADPVTKLVAPGVEEQVNAKLEEALGEALIAGTEDLTPDSTMLAELMKQMGLNEEFRAELIEKVETIMAETGAPLVTAVVEAAIRGVVYGVLYILAFLLLLVLLHFLAGTLDLMMKLPVLKSFNRLGGGLIGLLQGVVIVFLVAWLARVMGTSFELADTRVLRIFADSSFLKIPSFLQ